MGVEAAAYVAGHSLGEYSALAAAGSLTLGDAARLLRLRGRAMQAAVPVGEGAMAALLGVDFDTARRIAEEAAGGEVLQAANDNDPGQVVVSGARAAVERAVAVAKDHGAKRAVMLPVSAPFHCALMEPAARAMAEALGAVEVAAPRVPLVANVRAEAVEDPGTDPGAAGGAGDGRGALARKRGLDGGARGRGAVGDRRGGRALSGMAKRIDRSLSARPVGTAQEVRAAVESMGA